MINERVKYTANTKCAVVTTANSNLDGSGAIVSVLTGASNGTVVNRVVFKARSSTTRGMLRLYIMPYAGGLKSTARLFYELSVPAITQSAKTHSFEAIIKVDVILKAGDVLCASTEKAESFYIIAEGLDWTY